MGRYLELSAMLTGGSSLPHGQQSGIGRYLLSFPTLAHAIGSRNAAIIKLFFI
jgi:hypothetical protein